jgi:transposase
MPAKYRVQLTSTERDDLRSLTRRGTTAARTLTRARVLLLADRGLRDAEIADATGVDARTVQRLRRRWAEEGVEASLVDRPRPGAVRRLDGPQEAQLVALACSDPPTGRAHWTLRLLAERLVTLEVVDAISHETVRRTLKKTI